MNNLKNKSGVDLERAWIIVCRRNLICIVWDMPRTTRIDKKSSSLSLEKTNHSPTLVCSYSRKHHWKFRTVPGLLEMLFKARKHDQNIQKNIVLKQYLTPTQSAYPLSSKDGSKQLCTLLINRKTILSQEAIRKSMLPCPPLQGPGHHSVSSI